MSKLSEALREMRIRNTHELLLLFGGERDVAVLFSPAWGARCSCSYVYSPRFKTDPKSAWYQNGNKSFTGNRGESFKLAREWASEKYGITEWATDPTDRSGMLPKHVVEAAKQAVKAKP